MGASGSNYYCSALFPVSSWSICMCGNCYEPQFVLNVGRVFKYLQLFTSRLIATE